MSARQKPAVTAAAFSAADIGRRMNAVRTRLTAIDEGETEGVPALCREEAALEREFQALEAMASTMTIETPTDALVAAMVAHSLADCTASNLHGAKGEDAREQAGAAQAVADGLQRLCEWLRPHGADVAELVRFYIGGDEQSVGEVRP